MSTNPLDFKYVVERLDKLEAAIVETRGEVLNVSQSVSKLGDKFDALVVAMSGGHKGASAHARAVLARQVRAIPARRMLVLAVEDDDLMRRHYRKLFRRCELVDVGTCADARAHLRAFGARIELLVLDVGLPDGDGLELLAELRAIPGGPLVPVAVVTGYGQGVAEDVERISGPNTVWHVVDKAEAQDWFRERLNNGGFGYPAAKE